VVGVTAVDARRRVLPEAAQGSQVTFAAPGADMVAADGAGGFSLARGTSFAAPLVAGLLVQHVGALAPGNANAAVGALAAIGLDLGAPGRDPVFGLGLVGEELRASPMLARR
jgi:subtilisin family serine protease